ncbi:NADH-cytochrome b5 reductase [Pichia californica]|uniref:NADH-cytochrome b5 reductase n=1 Tax=Pichia californica TaxID=460514 RepID=A0A9P6WM62_9ASCO|nr:NADH-cytochrome b5 reductase [[Candida] californica]KAG0689560.1 NADH-cytochrome b5 reductase [[Candida] californica]
MSKFVKFLVPAAAIAGGAIYYQSLSTTSAAIAPVFKGDGEWIDLKLTNIKPVSHDSKIYTFSFPESNQTSGLITASAILTKYVTAKGNNVIRPYTPITDVNDKGSFDLLVKTYKGGKMSVHIENLKIDDKLSFKGPILKWKWEPNQFKEIGLIGGGTGITPLYQVIHEVLKNESDKTKITLLYGSKSIEDTLLKPELDELATKYPNQFTVKYFVDNADKSSSSSPDVTVGYITKDVLESTLPKPSSDSHVFICGPPPFYKAISGAKVSPTDQGEVSGVLQELGYTKSDVFKF